MRIWWITLGVTFIFCTFARIYSKMVVGLDGCITYKPNVFFSTLACIVLILVSGLRINIGDTKTYMNHFQDMPSDFIETVKSLNEDTVDGGFKILSAFIKNYITENPQIYILILAAITISLIFITLYKYCGVLELGIFIFITAGNYLVSMNGVRQYLVSAIMFFIFPLIYKKKWWIYLPIVGIVSSIHQSAIIFIPLYFIVNTEAWGKTSKMMLAMGILAYIFYPITAKITSIVLSDTYYSMYGEGILTGSAGGSNIIRSLVYTVPIVLSYIKREEIRKQEKYFDIMVNFSILNLVFMLLSNKSSWIFARYCIYFSLYMIILLCWCIKYILNKKQYRLIYYTCSMLFAAYYFYEMHISLNQIYISNIIKL